MKHILLILALICSLSVSAKKDRYTTVYMFGVATSFTDSTVVVTDIIAVDSAFVSKNGLLGERPLYSYQLENYLEVHQQKTGVTVAVFWSEDKKKVERDFLKVRGRFVKDPTTKVEGLTREQFVFRKVEHE